MRYTMLATLLADTPYCGLREEHPGTLRGELLAGVRERHSLSL